MQEIKWVEFHTPIFHPSGTNLGTKIEVSRRDGLVIEYDESKEVFLIHYKNRTAKSPRENAALWEDLNEETVKAQSPVNEHKTEDKSKRSKAQVSTPMGHVFEGPGAGKK